MLDTLGNIAYNDIEMKSTSIMSRWITKTGRTACFFLMHTSYVSRRATVGKISQV